MADSAPPSGQASGADRGSTAPQRPAAPLKSTQSTSNAVPTVTEESAALKKRRNHRGGKKKKNRRQSFAPPPDNPGLEEASRSNHDLLETTISATVRPSFYRLGQSGGGNLSETSLDSQALLDHRDHPPMRARRDSRLNSRAAQSNYDPNSAYRPSYTNPFVLNDGQNHWRARPSRAHMSSGGESENDDKIIDSRTPLLATTSSRAGAPTGYGASNGQGRPSRPDTGNRRKSATSSASSRHRRRVPTREPSASAAQQDYDVNNPPSVPGSPVLGPEMGYDDVMVTGSFAPRSLEERRTTTPGFREYVVNVDGDTGPTQQFGHSSPPTPRDPSPEQRRRTVAIPAEGDVCFPLEGMSELAEEDYMHNGQPPSYQDGPRRRRTRQWPDISVLHDWSREEKEERSEGIRAKKISEPVLIGGRLRPQKYGWHRAEEDAPYRFTYFNEEFQSTIHSQTISELLQPGQSWEELFIPEPPELSDDSSDEEDLISVQDPANDRKEPSPGGHSRNGTRQSSVRGDTRDSIAHPHDRSGEATPANPQNQRSREKPKRYGPRPTFWLDVLSPTDAEMRVISKTFGIHPLTAEDIMMQEAREKVELFRNYYFVNYRTFEQDMNSENYLEPINMYVVVFREGVISFHFSMTPHPANVRRRIRQLKDYLILSSDWISYAIIDDITDVFVPLIQSIEEEVDDIDDDILQLHSSEKDEPSNSKSGNNKDSDKRSETGEATSSDNGGDMLRRVGQGRKKVMGLYRLLGNKADVIKGFAKRCNEQWEIAPRSEIGLYLGDIQDHILTMTSNLSHYETLLSRAHSNYLAQINIRMNERQEQTADVLGKLTVLGTIVLPMNIITGMWGMNVLVPGQGQDNLTWFWCISAGLLFFGISCFFIAKRVYGIV